jgi:hypothetical protein
VYVLDFLGLPNNHPQNLCAFASLREKIHAAIKAQRMLRALTEWPFVSSGQAPGRHKEYEQADKQKKSRKQLACGM